MFITFEGPDGSGKTTALQKLVEYLDKKDIEYVLTREPGSPLVPLGKQLRDIIVNADYPISPMAEAILFTADRRQHLERVIWPALKEGKLVLCDRYFDSSFAYQGYARGLGIEKIISLNETVTESTYPDLTIYFDVPHHVANERVNSRGDKNRLDKEGEEFRSKVIEGYEKLIEMYPERYRVINATLSPADVFAEVKKLFKAEILKS